MEADPDKMFSRLQNQTDREALATVGGSRHRCLGDHLRHTQRFSPQRPAGSCRRFGDLPNSSTPAQSYKNISSVETMRGTIALLVLASCFPSKRRSLTGCSPVCSVHHLTYREAWTAQ